MGFSQDRMAIVGLLEASWCDRWNLKKLKFCKIWEFWGGFCMFFILVQNINGKNLPQTQQIFIFLFLFIFHTLYLALIVLNFPVASFQNASNEPTKATLSWFKPKLSDIFYFGPNSMTYKTRPRPPKFCKKNAFNFVCCTLPKCF